MLNRRTVLVLLGVFFVLGLVAGYGGAQWRGAPDPTKRAQALQVLDSSIDHDGNNFCVEFDRLLAAQQDKDVLPFVKVEPEVADLKARLSGRDLCLSGFASKVVYKVQLLAGLPAADGTTLRPASVFQAEFGDEDSRINFVGRGFILPRVGAVGLPIETVNVDKLRIRVLRIADRDLAKQMAENWWKGPVDPWQWRTLSATAATVVWEGSLSVNEKQADKAVTTAFPLTEVLPNRLPGAYLVTAEPWSTEYRGRYFFASNEKRPWATQWVVDTDVTLTTFEGEDDLVVFARSLDTAKPLPGVDLTLVSAGGDELARAHTDGTGRASFASNLLKGQGSNAARAVMALGPGTDFSVHDVTLAAFDLSDRGVSGRPSPGPLDAFAWTERGVYRPGEPVDLSVLMRDRMAHAAATPIRIALLRPDGSEWNRRTLSPNAAGGVHLSVELPKTAPLGLWQAVVYADPTGAPIGRVSFDVEDFVPQQLSVETSAAAGMLKAGDDLALTIRANWLYGAPGSGLATDVHARVMPDPDPFPALKGWQFGLFDDDFEAKEIDLSQARTDADGVASLSSDISVSASSRPLQLVVESGVIEPGGRPNPAPELTLPIDSKPAYLGLHPDFEGGRVVNGADAAVRVMAVDRAGKPVAQKGVQYELIEEDWHYLWSREEGNWHYKVSIEDRPSRTGTIDLGSEPAVLHFPTGTWMRYRLVVKTADGQAAASMRFAAGWQQSAEDDDEDETPDKVSVVPDKDHYAVGETAHVTIKPQFAGEAMVTLATSQPRESRQISVPAGGTTVDFPVTADWGPGLYVIVNHHRPLAGEAARGPIRAIGVAWLGVDNKTRTLAVDMNPPEVVRPDTTLHLPIKVGGAKPNEPAFVTVAAVDEGILAITQFQTPSPDSFYFGKRSLGVDIRDDYGKLIDGRLAKAGRIRQGGDESGSKGLSVVPTRTVALFSGPVELGPDGTAAVDLPIPDYVGKLRLMAVAYSRDAVGHGQAAAIVRPPVVVDAYLPRFLAPDDRASMVVSLDNVENRPGPFHVEVQANGPISLPEGGSADVAMDGSGRQSLRIAMASGDLGIGEVALRLTGPGGLDIHRSWPIQSRSPHYPLTFEQTAALAPGQSFSIDPQLLEAFLPSSASITVGLSYLRGIDVPALLTALDRYPYGCTEQTTSRALPLLSFDDPALLASSGVAPAPAELRQRVQKAIDTLVDRQGEDGRIGLWRRNDGHASAWTMVFATDFLMRAKEKAYEVPDAAVERAVRWLNVVASGNGGSGGDYYQTDVQSAQAYGLYALARLKRPNTVWAANLARNNTLSAVPMAMLGAALAMAGNDREADRAFDAATAAIDGKPSESMALYGSRLRDLAAVLALRVEARPGFDAGPLLERISRELGPISLTSTQEKAWLLRAAANLVHNEPIEAEVAAGGVQPASLSRTGTMALSPSRDQLKAGWSVTNRGQREVYRTLVIQGAPRNAPPPLQSGFELTKKWYSTDGTEIDPQSFVFRQQDRYVVSLSGTLSDGNQRHAMVVDMLPAGFEIERVLQKPGKDEASDYGWLAPVSRLALREARDDRMVAALDLNEPKKQFVWRRDDDDDDEDQTPAGREFHLAYVVRAVTPGRFTMPAASVEDMYRPAVMARTASGTITVDAK